MDWVLFEIKEKSFLPPSQQPYFLSQPPLSPISNLQSSGFNLNSKIENQMIWTIHYRANLLADFSPNNICSPLVLVLESGSESSREIVNTTNSVSRANSHPGFHCEDEFGSSRIDPSHKSSKIQVKDDANQQTEVGSEEKVVLVKLGKFRNVDNGGESSSNSNVDARRCFSMGSFQYVMDENSSLQVPIRTPMKKQSSKKPSLPLTPGHRPAMSECDCDSRREFNGFEPFEIVEIHGGSIGTSRSISNGNGNAIGRIKRESFSVSKIWLRGRKDKPNSMTVETSRRAFSFRFPVHRNVDAAGDDLKTKNGGSGKWRTSSEIDIGRLENGGSELGCDEEIQSCNSLDSRVNPPSFGRRTLLWLLGRQNKLVHSSFSPNV
ncbi:hypothetical protein F0562_030462 [Nyssa sinensis]|uniref:Uncharacterized protein n=1 Tax=Nyssa sinensis TaxID=561372 RepID=A0A5J5AYM2_9ASTE|nr:hypothetical protein F0562_030462 [Nyssa sinensis]